MFDVKTLSLLFILTFSNLIDKLEMCREERRAVILEEAEKEAISGLTSTFRPKSRSAGRMYIEDLEGIAL